MRNTHILVSFSCVLGLTLMALAPEAHAQPTNLACALDRLGGQAEAGDKFTLKVDYQAKVATWNGQTGPITLNQVRPDIVLLLDWPNARTAAFYRDTGKFEFSAKVGDRWYARSSTCRQS